MEDQQIVQRQVTNGTSSPGDDPSSFSFESWLATYWYILLIVLAILVVVCVLICACVLKRHPRSHSFQPHSRAQKSSTSHSQNGGSSQSHQSSIPTMPSLSADSTPIPSPHSSQHSVGIFNGRNRRASPRLSSASSDTLRPDVRSVSSNSSASLMGHSPTRQQERASPMERRGSLPRRTRSSPMVRVTSMPDVKNNLRPAPSTMSVESSSNGRSGVSYKFQPANDAQTFVEVGVTVHTPGDPDKAVRIATAAALAESARKLAQEAASFIDSGDETINIPTLSRGSRPYHPGSGRSSSFSLSQPSYMPRPHPITTANIDNPSTTPTRVGGGVIRGEQYPPVYYQPRPHGMSPRMFVNDSDYESFDYYERSNSIGSNYSSSQLPPHPFQRGRPYRSSLDNYHRDQESYRLPPRERITSPRETSFTTRRTSSSSVTTDHRYPQTSRRLPPDSNYTRKIPFHLTAAGRRQSAPGFDRRGGHLESSRRVNDRPPALPKVIQVPVEMEWDEGMEENRGGLNASVANSNKYSDVNQSYSLTESPSVSTGLSSNRSSMMEADQSSHPLQDNPPSDDRADTSQVMSANKENVSSDDKYIQETSVIPDSNKCPSSVSSPTQRPNPLTLQSSLSTDDSTTNTNSLKTLSTQSSCEIEEGLEDENHRNHLPERTHRVKASHSKSQTIPINKTSRGKPASYSSSLQRHRDSNSIGSTVKHSNYLSHISSNSYSDALSSPPTTVDVTVNV